jgi:hypothetical protein
VRAARGRLYVTAPYCPYLCALTFGCLLQLPSDRHLPHPLCSHATCLLAPRLPPWCLPPLDSSGHLCVFSRSRLPAHLPPPASCHLLPSPSCAQVAALLLPSLRLQRSVISVSSPVAAFLLCHFHHQSCRLLPSLTCAQDAALVPPSLRLQRSCLCHLP